MKKQLNPPNFTKALGAYSHGISVDVGDCELIFLTGQLAMNENNDAVAPNDVEKQAEYVFQNIQKILAEAGSNLEDVVKVVIYLTNINDFAKISPIRNKYFQTSKPASTLIEISKTVKEGCDVQVDVTAVRKKD